MIRSIFITTLVVTISLLATAIFAQEYDYLPIVPQQTNHYVKVGDHHTRILRYFNQLSPTAEYCSDVRIDGRLSKSIAMSVLVDRDGNISCHGGCWCPVQSPCQLDPPEMMILAPLEVGKAWESWCNSSVHGPMHFSSEVIRFDKIKVPAGTFECYVVERRINTWTWTYSSYEWYSDKIGIVKFSWPWIGTFELLPKLDELGPNIYDAVLKSDDITDQDTWGGVKALYR